MFSLKPLKDYQHNFPSERKTQRLATNFKAMKHVSTHRTMPLFKKNILFPSHSFLYCVFRYLLNRGSTSIINETAAYSNWNEPNRQKSYVPLQLRPIRKLRAIRKLRRINNVIFPPFPLIYCFPQYQSRLVKVFFFFFWCPNLGINQMKTDFFSSSVLKVYMFCSRVFGLAVLHELFIN